VPRHGVSICRSFCSRRYAVDLSRWTNRTGGAAGHGALVVRVRCTGFSASPACRSVRLSPVREAVVGYRRCRRCGQPSPYPRSFWSCGSLPRLPPVDCCSLALALFRRPAIHCDAAPIVRLADFRIPAREDSGWVTAPLATLFTLLGTIRNIGLANESHRGWFLDEGHRFGCRPTLALSSERRTHVCVAGLQILAQVRPRPPCQIVEQAIKALRSNMSVTTIVTVRGLASFRGGGSTE
jgi:hypothetical protein